MFLIIHLNPRASEEPTNMIFLHRAGQRCFELLALIGSPQLSFSKVFPAEQTSWPNWQTLWACTEADEGINDFSLVVL